ncbi:Cytochrome c [Symmachiella dynata]|uniref:PVC-type heme-binding CxxCH protein n=1 Tax=Symmachiella dynata TaxID=2527995 RepID=UPI00118CD474|nr:PVC-type heme-binding CxxCH protein [Symmachiella dynata]QDT46032.1 Cytochrome c [Symmachiella dynata]
MLAVRLILLFLVALTQLAIPLVAAPPIIPRRQDKPPGPPLSPQDAIAKMTVPEGFTVELVASEPDIINPVAMTFDERGRIWITESVEYPRSSPGKGRDRIKVLEDTDGDGRVDKTTVFADGLNIPSGIAVGYGGVWVANAPDILFLRDTDGDLKADTTEVVVTGFGRDDTHELPNSLTWGPDGYLYGLNGVFNHSHVRQNGKEFEFTCALFRINPRTREFELFCEGTSNPWGVTWDEEGSAFISACVIDHLWHLTETGYYHRQGGPYPPFTWKLQSIVKHKHQKAAYCGIHYFDSDAYPPEYRNRLYMGNIHGGCLNVDVLERKGSTYFATPRPDFLTANDVWFMPVAQKTGPDGCLYVLDWYDRYHCYQDARRDTPGVDRLKGRLYRIRYKNTPRAETFDMASESGDELIERLSGPNDYFRGVAQRLLAERNDTTTNHKLQELCLNNDAPRKTRLHALWALIGTGALEEPFHRRLLEHDDATFRAWGVRAAGNYGDVSDEIDQRIAALASDDSPDVQLQVAIAAPKIDDLDTMPVLSDVLSHCGNDQLIPHIVWQNLHPRLDEQPQRFIELLTQRDFQQDRNIMALLPRLLDRLLAVEQGGPESAAQIYSTLIASDNDQAAPNDSLIVLAKRIQTGELAGDRLSRLRTILEPRVQSLLTDDATPPQADTVILAASWGDKASLDICRQLFESAEQPTLDRIRALEVLASHNDKTILPTVQGILTDPEQHAQKFRAAIIATLGQMQDPGVADVILAAYPGLEPDLQPDAIERLTDRGQWSKKLLTAIDEKKIPASAINVNQVRKLLASKDKDLIKSVRSVWGTVRTKRDPNREKVLAQMRTFLRKTPGDAAAGQQVFHKLCGQCHTIHGKGADLGPDITVNGRASYDQLLSNVFDPSLVIGAAYRATIIVTTKGRVVTGLVVEDNAQRIVLKVQGGKLETIPRDQIEERIVSKLSMMPENLESQLKPQEMADLFEFLTRATPPGDPHPRHIPGTPQQK